MGIIYQVNSNHERSEVIILTSDRIESKIRIITRDKERHFIMIKMPIHQEYVTIINICTPNSKPSKQMRHNQLELK